MFLQKCRRTLRTGVRLLKKKGNRLIERERMEFENDLRALDHALLDKKRKEACEIAGRVKAFMKTHFPKTSLDHLKELIYALAFAVVVAFFIRQFWFELYEVPTGSMRPTIEELDRLVVSRTTFGIHIPFVRKPLFFSDELVKRAGIIVFTVSGMDVADSNTLYFYLIPGKKRFVKRAMSKPGDTVYFYGGYLYGIDNDGKEIITLADPQFLERYRIEKIDHIPYITFEGKTKVGKSIGRGIYDSVQFLQMDIPVGKMHVTRMGKIEGEFYNGKSWTADRPNALKSPHDMPKSYSDLWGIGNYAMARLLTKEQVSDFYGKVPENDRNSSTFLELRHTPNLTYPKPEMRRDEMGRIHPMITPMVALIPLSQTYLDTIQKALFTARFYVKNGHAYRYSEGRRPQPPEYDPLFPGVPNGLYEFQNGIGYKVHFGGIRTTLPLNHPLYSKDPENIRKLFNLGVGFNLIYEPMAPNQPYNPQRFAYYRNGDLYIMGAPILKKNDATLVRFVTSEEEKQNKSSQEEPYIAFVDHGPPLKNGKVDSDFIQAFGLKVPESGVLALGDNYSNSGDSREFGFVPKENLLGSPSFTFWPPGKRFGPLPQPPYPWITASNFIIWGLVILIAIGSYFYFRIRNQRSHFD